MSSHPVGRTHILWERPWYNYTSGKDACFSQKRCEHEAFAGCCPAIDDTKGWDQISPRIIRRRRYCTIEMTYLSPLFGKHNVISSNRKPLRSSPFEDQAIEARLRASSLPPTVLGWWFSRLRCCCILRKLTRASCSCEMMLGTTLKENSSLVKSANAVNVMAGVILPSKHAYTVRDAALSRIGMENQQNVK